MSRSITLPLQLDISRKTAKTVPLKLSKYLYKNTFYNYAEQLIGFMQLELLYKRLVKFSVTLLTVRNQLSRF